MVKGAGHSRRLSSEARVRIQSYRRSGVQIPPPALIILEIIRYSKFKV